MMKAVSNSHRKGHFSDFSTFHYSFLFSFLLLGLFQPVYRQNLLPDCGFEIVSHTNCVSPEQGFRKMEYWYLLDATPDLFERSCPFDESGFVFWDEEVVAYEGNNYAGLWSRWNSNATYFTEGIATSLTQPLEAGKTYFFELALLDQGTYQGLVSGNVDCVLDPDRHIDLYVYSDSIEVINDFANGTASTEANLVATFPSAQIGGLSDSEWTLVSTCFEANDGETFFASSMPLGTFGELPECAQTDLGSGIFRSFYYNIDAAFLRELPESLETEITVCDNQDFEVTLTELFELSLLETAQFTWEDGASGVFRRLSEPGTYSIQAEIDCKTIPLTLTALPEICQINIYVHNAFSPNADGINDELMIYLSSGLEIQNFEMQVFDRWGGMIFQSNDPALGWDGTKLGEELPQGVYTWFVRFETTSIEGTKTTVESGTVLLLK